MKLKESYLKVLKILMCFVMMFTLVCQNMTEAKAIATIYPYNPNAEIPGEYYNQYTGYKTEEMTMSSHFIPTPSEGVGNIAPGGMKYYVPESTLKNANNFGQIWWQYNNVMTVNNQKIHIRFTALSWNNTSLRYGYLGIRTSSTIGAYTPRNTRIRVQFINASTGQPVSVKTSLTGRDFDSSTIDTNIEKMVIHSGIDRVYLGEWMTSSGQTIWNAHGTDVTSSEKRAWATFCINGSSFEYTYTKGGQLVFYKGDGVVPIEKRYKITTKSTNATITATQNEIIKGSSRTISWSAKNGYYISSVKIDGVSQPINSYRSGSYTFSNIQADHTVEVVATAQYHITTQGTNVTITDPIYNIDPSSSRTVSWNAEDGYWISSVIIDGISQTVDSYRGGSHTFNDIHENHDVKVVANPCYTITTEVVNGKITNTQTKIDPGEDRTISFSPNEHYYVSEVIVDGHAYSYKDYASSYTFDNIQGNHHIKVVCEPLKTITTEIENGIITKTMTDVHPDDSKEVIYSAFEDYYIDKVIVDGKEITVDDFRTGNYEFDPVVTDHYVKVVCEPKPLITTEIVNGTITPEFRVYPHEDGYVHFRANDGYYVSRVLVDNQPYYNFEEYEDEYGFYNITEDHHVYVECVPMPDFKLEKTTDKEVYNYKDTILYSVEVTQTVQNTSAYNVVISDANIPANIHADLDSLNVSGIDKQDYSLEKGTESWKLIIDELAYNQKAVVIFEAEIDDIVSVGTDVINTVYLTSDHFNSQLKESVTNHILKPELDIEKTSDQAKYNTRDTVNYTIEVNQTVEDAKAFDVLIKDEGITKGVQIDMNTIEVAGTDDYTLSKGDNSFEVKIPEMTDTQNIFITYQAKINDDTLAGKTISNSANVTSLTNTEIVKDTVENEVYKPQLVLSKVTDKDYYNVEDEAQFSITLTQSEENAIAHDVVLKDTDISSGVDIDFKSLQVNGIDQERYSIEKSGNGFEIHFNKMTNEVITITYNARINDNGLAGNDIQNSVEAYCANNPEKVTTSVEKPVLKPELTIEKISNSANYNVGDELEFTLKINQTVEKAIANHVIIKDFDLTEGIQLNLDSLTVDGISKDMYTITKDKENNTFTVEINAVAYNQTITVSVKGTVVDNALAGKEISNSASVTSSNNPDVVQDIVKADVYKPILEIQKTADKDIYNVKDEITYTLNINQTAKNARANDVVINDIIPDGLELDINSFVIKGIEKDNYVIEETEKGFMIKINALEDKATISYKAKIVNNDLAGKSVMNKADVTCSNNPDVIKTEAESKIAKPVLSLVKEVDKEKINVGDTLSYALTLKQTDKNAIANDVVLKDQIPDGLILDEDSVKVEGIKSEGYSLTVKENKIELSIAKLSYNVPVTVKFDAKVTSNDVAGKDIENTASASCSNNPETVKDQVISNVYQPILSIEKTADKDIYNVKDEITYTLNIKQTAENARANDVVINDIIPDGLELDINSFVIKGIEKDNYVIEETEKGFMIKINALEDKATISYKAKIVNNDLAGKSVMNKADVTCSNNPDVIKTEAESKIAKPVLSLVKEVDKEKINVGDTLSYALTLKQTDKNAIANDVVLKDQIPDGLTLDEDSVKVEGIKNEEYSLTVEENKIELSIAKLSYNVPVKVSFNVKVTSNELSGKEVENSATATSSNNPETVKAQVITNVYKPMLSIEKSSDKEIYNVKDTIIYTLNVQQTVENARANDIIVNDIIPDGLELDMRSFVIKGIEKDNYVIEKTEKGFMIKINALEDSATISYKAKIVDNKLAGQSVINQADITCSNNPDIVETQLENLIVEPGLAIMKTTDKESYNVHDNIHYVITIQQTDKNAVANDVVIHDFDMTDGLKLLDDTISVSGLTEDQNYEIITDGNSFSVYINYLNYDQKVVIEYDALVDDNNLADRNVINKANITCSNNSDVIEAEVKNKILMPVFEIKKTTDKEYYNYGEVIHYTVKTRQTVKNAIAYDVVLDDTHLNQGLEIDMDSIEVKGIDQFEIEKSGNGYVLIPDNPISDEEITITYDALVDDKALEGRRINHDVYIWCSNNPYVAKWESEVANTIIKPKPMVIIEDNAVVRDGVVVTDDSSYIALPALTIVLAGLGIYLFRKKA